LRDAKFLEFNGLITIAIRDELEFHKYPGGKYWLNLVLYMLGK
jgi:hypothetical protein